MTIATSRFRPFSTLLLPGLAVLLAAGCGQAGEQSMMASADDDDDDAIDRPHGDKPSLYIDQQVERLERGKNVLREGYLAQLDNCRKSGAPVRPLGDADVARIGTERWRMWRDTSRFAYRVERWEVEQPSGVARESICAFTLARAGIHGYADVERSVTVDIASGERSEGEGDPNVLLAPVDGANDPMDLDIARKRGMQGPARQTVAGQPCDRWVTSQGGNVCVWAGGTAWGIGSIADGDFLATDGPNPDYIVLAATPRPDGVGDRIETKAFVAGAPLDETDMMPSER